MDKKDFAEIAKGVFAKPIHNHVVVQIGDTRDIFRFSLSSKEDAESWVLERYDRYYEMKGS